VVNALDIVAPKKKFKIPKIWEGKKWYSDDIRVATKRRDEAYIKAMQTRVDEDWLQFKLERNMVIKLIRKEKKLYYENMIDCNKNDPVKMWKTLKEVIRGEKTGTKEINEVDFEILQNIGEYDLADKFNLYYIQSIDDIIESIGEENSNSNRTIYVIENKGIIENFELIDIYKLERIVMSLPRKKGTDEGITSDILKACFSVIGEELKNQRKQVIIGQ